MFSRRDWSFVFLGPDLSSDLSYVRGECRPAGTTRGLWNDARSVDRLVRRTKASSLGAPKGYSFRDDSGGKVVGGKMDDIA